MSGATRVAVPPVPRRDVGLYLRPGLNKVWAHCHTLPNAWQSDYQCLTLPQLPSPSLGSRWLRASTSSCNCSLLISSRPSEGGVHEYHFPAQPFSCHPPKTGSANGVLIYRHIHDRTLWSSICMYIFLLTFLLRSTERPISYVQNNSVTLQPRAIAY
jgi:hypothetical protein